MYICRLFHRDRPFEQLEARLLAQGSLTLGRDPAADWPLDDGDGALSRIHCELFVQDGRLWLRDRSTNGTFVRDARAPHDAPVELQAHESFRLGGLSVLIDRPDTGALDGAATVTLTPRAPTPLPKAWSDGPAAPAGAPPAADPVETPGGALLEAFCQGARLDASALAGEDPADLMRRVGEIYQQTVLGLATLMADRARVKDAHQLQRTTIAAADNNPFKWAPTRKLAEDLLCGREAGFLSDAQAVRASFEDLGRHLAALEASAGAGAAHALPDALARLHRGRGAHRRLPAARAHGGVLGHTGAPPRRPGRGGAAAGRGAAPGHRRRLRPRGRGAGLVTARSEGRDKGRMEGRAGAGVPLRLAQPSRPAPAGQRGPRAGAPRRGPVGGGRRHGRAPRGRPRRRPADRVAARRWRRASQATPG